MISLSRKMFPNDKILEKQQLEICSFYCRFWWSNRKIADDPRQCCLSLPVSPPHPRTIHNTRNLRVGLEGNIEGKF